MAVMTEQSDDERRETRWSANKKTDAVLRLLRGEPLNEVSRQLGSRRTGWRHGGTSSWPPGRSG